MKLVKPKPCSMRHFSQPMVIGLLGVLALSCKSGDAPSGKRSPVPKPSEQPAAVARFEPAAPEPAAATEVQFPDNVTWHSWEEGLSVARRESKPMMVVVYADWCPKCRSLTPVFRRPDIEALAQKLVLVRQNHDDEPAWLESYNLKYGGYVPRIFFFGPDGRLREDVTSGHPRYPYFYAAQQPEHLTRSMKKAIRS